MAMKAEVKAKQRVLAPEGVHAARCINIIDLGTQHSEKYNSDTRQLQFTFELVDETHVFDEEKGEQPFIIGRKFSYNLGKRAALRKTIEAWIGKGLKEGSEFDIGSLLGEACQVQVVHNEGDNGETYANIAAVLAPPKKGKVTRAASDLVILDLDEFDKEVFSSLPEWIQEIIKLSPEYDAIVSSGKLGKKEKTPASKTPAKKK